MIFTLKKSKALLFVLLFFSFCLTSTSSFSSAYDVRYRVDFEDCVKMALRYNQEIKAAGFDIETIIAKRIEATKRYIPVINYKYRVAPVPQDLNNPLESFFRQGDVSILNSFRVEFGTPVYTFGKIKLARELADLGIELKTLEKQKKEDEITLNIYKLYQGITLARELKALILEGLDSVEKKIEELEKEEVVDQIEILKLKVLLYEAERRMQEAITKEQIAITTLKVLVGVSDDADFNIKHYGLRRAGFKDIGFKNILEEAKFYRAEYKLLDKGVKAKGKKIDLEKKSYYPDFGFGGFAEYGITPYIVGDENDNAFNNPFNFTRGGVGFELSGKLDFRKYKAKVNEAKADYYKTMALQKAAHRGLELDLKKSYLELKRHRFLLSRAEKDKRAARQIVFLTKSNLDVGVGEKKDYLDALQSYLVFQGRFFEAMFHYNTAVADLKSRMGRLYSNQSQRVIYRRDEEI